MEKNKEIKKLSHEFNFADVPNWYVLCNNNHCPLRENCLRFLAGSHAPDNLEIATCVMPKTLKGDRCRWFEKKTVVVYATGFSHLYDCVMTKDYTTMRKTITRYLHGSKQYYEYMRGERPLSPEQQQWIKDYVKSLGYEWEVEFDGFFEAYVYNQLVVNR